MNEHQTAPAAEVPAYMILLSVRLTSHCPHGKLSNTCCGNAEWMQVIHAVNAVQPDSFGEPTSTYPQSGGRWFEEYPAFRVIIGGRPENHTNYVQAKTPAAAELLHLAVRQVLGFDVDDNGQRV